MYNLFAACDTMKRQYIYEVKVQFIILRCYYIITLIYILIFFKELVNETAKLHFTSLLKVFIMICNRLFHTFYLHLHRFNKCRASQKLIYILKFVMYVLFSWNKYTNINLVWDIKLIITEFVILICLNINITKTVFMF